MTAPRSASPYQVGGVLPPQATSPYHGGAAVPRPVSPYHGAMTPVAPRPVSPYMPGAVPRAVSPRPQYYPSGHVMEGQPVPGTGIIPRSASPGMPGPSPYATSALGSSPSSYPMNMPRQGYPEQQMLSSPEGFSRPPNLSQPYTPFEVLKVQDLDDFFESMPKMPLALVSHDVYHEDWIRFMTVSVRCRFRLFKIVNFVLQDLTLSWSGKLPTPDYAREAGPPRRTALTGDLVDLWNVSFFLKRGVEVILYKGRERRSGREIGRVDVHLPGFDDYPGDYDSEDSLTEDSDDYNSGGDDRYAYGAYGGSYGRQTESQMHDLHEAKQRDRRAREKRRAEKKKRRQEKRHRRRQKEAERKYALYLSYVPPS